MADELTDQPMESENRLTLKLQLRGKSAFPAFELEIHSYLAVRRSFRFGSTVRDHLAHKLIA